MKNFLTFLLCVALAFSTWPAHAMAPADQISNNIPETWSACVTRCASAAYDYAVKAPFSWAVENPGKIAVAAVLTGVAYKFYTAYNAKTKSRFNRAAVDKALIESQKEYHAEAPTQSSSQGPIPAPFNASAYVAKQAINKKFFNHAKSQFSLDLYEPSDEHASGQLVPYVPANLPDGMTHSVGLLKRAVARMQPGELITLTVRKEVFDFVLSKIKDPVYFKNVGGELSIRIGNGECIYVKNTDRNLQEYTVTFGRAIEEKPTKKPALLQIEEEEEPAILADKSPQDVINAACVLYNAQWLAYDDGDGYADFDLLGREAHIIANNVQHVCQDRRLEAHIHAIKDIPIIKNHGHATQINDALCCIYTILSSQGMVVVHRA